MFDVILNRDEVQGTGFVNIGSVASAIARANRTSNLAQAERKLFWRVNSGVQLGLLNPLDPETLEPLSREDYGMGVVPFHELVKWGHATKLFNFKSEFISPAAVPWAMAAPSMRDMVTAAQAKAALVVTQEPEAAPLVPPEPPAARALTENSSGGVEPAKAGPLPVLTKRTNRQTWLDVSLPYLVETYKAGQYATAKAFYKALESMAGTGDSPFDMGVGPNARSLFVRAIGQPVALKTMENAWAKIRNSP